MDSKTSYSSSMFDNESISLDNLLEIVSRKSEELVKKVTQANFIEKVVNIAQDTQKLDVHSSIEIVAEIPLLKLDKEVTDPINIIRSPSCLVDTKALSNYIKDNNINNIVKLELCLFNKDRHKCSTIVLQGDDMFKLHYSCLNIHATSNKYKAIAYMQDIDTLYIAMIQNVIGKTAKEESKSKIDQSYLNSMELTNIIITYRI